MTATAQTTATCHRPARAPVRTATWTAPQPKKTSKKVPSASARQRAVRGTGRSPTSSLVPKRSERSPYTLTIVRANGQGAGGAGQELAQGRVEVGPRRVVVVVALHGEELPGLAGGLEQPLP